MRFILHVLWNLYSEFDVEWMPYNLELQMTKDMITRTEQALNLGVLKRPDSDEFTPQIDLYRFDLMEFLSPAVYDAKENTPKNFKALQNFFNDVHSELGARERLLTVPGEKSMADLGSAPKLELISTTYKSFTKVLNFAVSMVPIAPVRKEALALMEIKDEDDRKDAMETALTLVNQNIKGVRKDVIKELLYLVEHNVKSSSLHLYYETMKKMTTANPDLAATVPDTLLQAMAAFAKSSTALEYTQFIAVVTTLARQLNQQNNDASQMMVDLKERLDNSASYEDFYRKVTGLVAANYRALSGVISEEKKSLANINASDKPRETWPVVEQVLNLAVDATKWYTYRETGVQLTNWIGNASPSDRKKLIDDLAELTRSGFDKTRLILFSRNFFDVVRKDLDPSGTNLAQALLDLMSKAVRDPNVNPERLMLAIRYFADRNNPLAFKNVDDLATVVNLVPKYVEFYQKVRRYLYNNQQKLVDSSNQGQIRSFVNAEEPVNTEACLTMATDVFDFAVRMSPRSKYVLATDALSAFRVDDPTDLAKYVSRLKDANIPIDTLSTFSNNLTSAFPDPGTRRVLLINMMKLFGKLGSSPTEGLPAVIEYLAEQKAVDPGKMATLLAEARLYKPFYDEMARTLYDKRNNFGLSDGKSLVKRNLLLAESILSPDVRVGLLAIIDYALQVVPADGYIDLAKNMADSIERKLEPAERKELTSAVASLFNANINSAMLRKFLLGIKQVLGNNPEGANVDQAVAALVSLSQIPGFTPAKTKALFQYLGSSPNVDFDRLADSLNKVEAYNAFYRLVRSRLLSNKDSLTVAVVEFSHQPEEDVTSGRVLSSTFKVIEMASQSKSWLEFGEAAAAMARASQNLSDVEKKSLNDTVMKISKSGVSLASLRAFAGTLSNVAGGNEAKRAEVNAALESLLKVIVNAGVSVNLEKVVTVFQYFGADESRLRFNNMDELANEIAFTREYRRFYVDLRARLTSNPTAFEWKDADNKTGSLLDAKLNVDSEVKSDSVKRSLDKIIAYAKEAIKWLPYRGLAERMGLRISENPAATKQVMDIVNLDLSRETLSELAKAFNGITVSDANRRAGLINAVLKLVEKATNEQIVGLNNLQPVLSYLASAEFNFQNADQVVEELKSVSQYKLFYMFVRSQLTIKELTLTDEKGNKLVEGGLNPNSPVGDNKVKTSFENVLSFAMRAAGWSPYVTVAHAVSGAILPGQKPLEAKQQTEVAKNAALLIWRGVKPEHIEAFVKITAGIPPGDAAFDDVVNGLFATVQAILNDRSIRPQALRALVELIDARANGQGAAIDANWVNNLQVDLADLNKYQKFYQTVSRIVHGARIFADEKGTLLVKGLKDPEPFDQKGETKLTQAVEKVVQFAETASVQARFFGAAKVLVDNNVDAELTELLVKVLRAGVKPEYIRVYAQVIAALSEDQRAEFVARYAKFVDQLLRLPGVDLKRLGDTLDFIANKFKDEIGIIEDAVKMIQDSRMDPANLSQFNKFMRMFQQKVAESKMTVDSESVVDQRIESYVNLMQAIVDANIGEKNLAQMAQVLQRYEGNPQEFAAILKAEDAKYSLQRQVAALTTELKGKVNEAEMKDDVHLAIDSLVQGEREQVRSFLRRMKDPAKVAVYNGILDLMNERKMTPDQLKKEMERVFQLMNDKDLLQTTVNQQFNVEELRQAVARTGMEPVKFVNSIKDLLSDPDFKSPATILTLIQRERQRNRQLSTYASSLVTAGRALMEVFYGVAKAYAEAAATFVDEFCTQFDDKVKALVGPSTPIASYLDMVRAGFKFDKYVDLKLADRFQDQSFIQIDFPVLDQQDDSKMIRTASFMYLVSKFSLLSANKPHNTVFGKMWEDSATMLTNWRDSALGLFSYSDKARDPIQVDYSAFARNSQAFLSEMRKMFATEPGTFIKQRLAVLDEFKKTEEETRQRLVSLVQSAVYQNLVADAKANTLPHQENWMKFLDTVRGLVLLSSAGDKAALSTQNTINDLQARIRGLKADIENKKRQITSLDTDKATLVDEKKVLEVERKKLAKDLQDKTDELDKLIDDANNELLAVTKGVPSQTPIPAFLGSKDVKANIKLIFGLMKDIVNSYGDLAIAEEKWWNEVLNARYPATLQIAQEQKNGMALLFSNTTLSLESRSKSRRDQALQWIKELGDALMDLQTADIKQAIQKLKGAQGIGGSSGSRGGGNPNNPYYRNRIDESLDLLDDTKHVFPVALGTRPFLRLWNFASHMAGAAAANRGTILEPLAGGLEIEDEVTLFIIRTYMTDKPAPVDAPVLPTGPNHPQSAGGTRVAAISQALADEDKNALNATRAKLREAQEKTALKYIDQLDTCKDLAEYEQMVLQYFKGIPRVAITQCRDLLQRTGLPAFRGITLAELINSPRLSEGFANACGLYILCKQGTVVGLISTHSSEVNRITLFNTYIQNLPRMYRRVKPYVWEVVEFTNPSLLNKIGIDKRIRL